MHSWVTGFGGDLDPRTSTYCRNEELYLHVVILTDEYVNVSVYILMLLSFLKCFKTGPWKGYPALF